MNFLITGALPEGKKYITELEKLGHKAIFMQNEKDSVPCPYDWIEGLICNGFFLHHDCDSLTSLRYVQLTSAGYDRVPLERLKQKNIKVFNARGVYSAPMAEFALASVLCIYKNMEFFMENQKKHKWEKNRHLLELSEKVVCIAGCGSVGTECAKRFRAFGCTVTGVDPVVVDSPYFDQIYSIDKIDLCLNVADVVILTLPLTGETHHFMDEARLGMMKKGCVLVNISRGGIIDTGAMIKRLENKDLFAVLDVFEDEPLSEDSPLWDMDNVIVTPHNSFVGDLNNKRLHDLIFNNLKESNNA